MASYYVRSAATGAANGTSWTDAYTTLVTALSGKAAGDIFYVAADHAETAASAKTISSPGTSTSPCYVYCVDHTGSVPPVAADLRTTASITTTGTFSITLNGTSASVGSTYVYGINFNSGTGAGAVALSIGGTLAVIILESCNLNILSTSASSNIALGYASSSSVSVRPNRTELINTNMSFGAVGQFVNIAGGDVIWKGGAISGSAPTALFSTSGSGGYTRLEGVDLSNMGAGKTIVEAHAVTRDYTLKNCKLGASVTVAATSAQYHYPRTTVQNSDSAGTNYRNERYTSCGVQTSETVVVRTGGASDGTTSVAYKITTSAANKWIMPFDAIPIAIWNGITASDVTATLEGVWNAAALPNNDDIWFDLGYMGSASSPQATFKTSSKATNLSTGAALTASTEAWDSLVTARANSTVYALGDVRKVASNSGRIFFCTTAGTSAGSEPAGYASAVDGGSVTDNTAVFRAGMRFKLAVTATSPQPQAAGYMYLYPKAAKVSSTFYIDPKVTLA